MVNVLYALAALATVVVPWIILLGAAAGAAILALSSGLSLAYAAILYADKDDDTGYCRPAARDHLLLAGLLAVLAVAVALSLPTLRTYLAI